MADDRTRGISLLKTRMIDLFNLNHLQSPLPEKKDLGRKEPATLNAHRRQPLGRMNFLGN
jgi:hypothetical protein